MKKVSKPRCQVSSCSLIDLSLYVHGKQMKLSGWSVVLSIFFLDRHNLSG